VKDQKKLPAMMIHPPEAFFYFDLQALGLVVIV
jgi:hypothetical protein